MSRLVLPTGVQAPIPPVRAQAAVVPLELSMEVRKLLPLAEPAGVAIAAVDRGSAGVIALMMQEGVRVFLQSHLDGFVPMMTMQLAQSDRHQIFQAMQGVFQSRREKSILGREQIDLRTYEVVLTDLLSVMQQVPPCNVKMDISIPVLTEIESTIDAIPGLESQTKEVVSVLQVGLEDNVKDPGGPIVKDWGGYFLRDDIEIRRGTMVPEQAYSLFQREPYGRLEVLAGSLEWALERSEETIASFLKTVGSHPEKDVLVVEVPERLQFPVEDEGGSVVGASNHVTGESKEC